MRVWPGQPQPLGATWDGEGVNFAVWAEEAHQVLLCLFDAAGDADSEQRIPLREKSGGVWHGYLPDVRPGQLYGWRVDGPYAPGEGHRFNPHKLLVDPYARALSVDPDYAAPPFFMGVMKVREGDLASARELWRQSLARTPADAPWRPELERRVVTIEAVLAQIEAEEQAVLQRNRDGAKRASPPDSMSGDNDNDRRGAISR